MLKWQKNIAFILLFLLIAQLAFTQQNKINPNGYNVFYYPNGVKQSEGYMKDGKPDGYWINYYPDGKKKSEGNRKNFLLDSVWTFYNEFGDTTKKITYYLGKKNGWYIIYYTHLDSNFVKNIPKEKYLYVNDLRQGTAYFYYPDGKLWKTIPFKDNYAHGIGFEYAPDGRIITIIEYRYGKPIDMQAINRYDSSGAKNGLWQEYYPNGQLKWQGNYVHGKLNGIVKFYNKYGALTKVLYYKNGKLIQQNNGQALKSLKGNIRLVEIKYPNGKLKHTGTYKDSIPIGIHKFYSPSGKLDSAVIYNDLGIKTAKGLLDSNGRKTGTWTLFYDDGKIYAIGKYKNGKRQGSWKFFYKDGKLLEKGFYRDGQPHGQWTWYYPNGKVLRIENFDYGIRQGPYYELSQNGDTIVKANYSDGELHGHWYLQVGDFMQTVNYKYGRKTGTWKTFYYPEKKLMCIDHYQNNKPNGKHKCYYPNGRIKEYGEYLDGKKNGKWYYYTPSGYLFYTITYQLDDPVKIDGTKLNP